MCRQKKMEIALLTDEVRLGLARLRRVKKQRSTASASFVKDTFRFTKDPVSKEQSGTL